VLLTTPFPNHFSPNANYSKNASTTIGIFLPKLLASPLASVHLSHSSIRSIPVSGERGLLPLRLAYGTFFLVHILLAVASLTGLPLNPTSSGVVSDETVLSTLALALIFAIGRNTRVKETYGRGLLAIFLAYGVITLTYLLYHSFISHGWEGPRSPGPEGSLSWIFIVFHLFWISSAAEAARCSKIFF
jgi:hypothetical protein